MHCISGRKNEAASQAESNFLDRLTAFVNAVLAVMLVYSFLLDPVRVDGISMEVPVVLRFANLTETGKGFLRGMLWINTYYIMGQAVNTTLIAGVFRAGGDSRFGFICDTIDMWLYAVPLGFLAAMLKLPPMWVYFLLCTDEFVKWPWVIGHYRSRKWLRNITRENAVEA